tara:strand:- start:72 stop:1211 length:1140 start_codon:yes stop_codon:yes gene_type:complete
MNNIRLLQVVPTLNSGGVEQGTFDIAKAISESGNFSSVVSNGGRMVKLFEKYGSKHFKIGVDSKNPFVIYNNISRLRKILIQEKINIMHTRSRAPAWSSFHAGKNKVKLISTFHNIYGHENKFKRIYNSGLAKMDKIIAISNFVKNGIIKLYNVPQEKITVIYRGIDEEIFNLEKINEILLNNFIIKHNIVNDKKIILFPGRLTPWKGQIEFIDVLKKLKYKDFFCYFVGDDKNKNFTKKLSLKINNSGLNENCKIVGHIDSMKYFYQLSHVVVNASQKPEGFGRVVAEAMAMGKPVVAYNHGGVSEQISIYENSFKIPINNYQKMALAIDNFLTMPQDSIYTLGQMSSAFVKKNFTKKSMVSHTLYLYNNLLNEKKYE